MDVLAAYLGTYNSHGLQLVRLNNCGLTGKQISRLFRSMGQARRLTIHLNGNRLDEGIDDLCSAIANGYGPWSVFLQMIEFASEANYIKLLRALTVNKTIECLSLAGTATPDSASGVACQAVSEFFSKNDTVRFLDISGYDSKLDEGRLGREFSKALSGMRSNTRIEHLRVRSQMLNINIGDLAEAISGNKALHTLDCEGNDFNLSNFRHLIKHLEDSTTIRYFSAFSAQELSRAIRKSVETAGAPTPIMRRSSVMARFRSEKVQPGTGKPLVQQLRDEWDAAVADLERVLQRNQQILLDKEESDDETVIQLSGRLGEVENASRKPSEDSHVGSSSPEEPRARKDLLLLSVATSRYQRTQAQPTLSDRALRDLCLRSLARWPSARPRMGRARAASRARLSWRARRTRTLALQTCRELWLRSGRMGTPETTTTHIRRRQTRRRTTDEEIQTILG